MVSRDLYFNLALGGGHLTVAEVEQAAETLQKVSELYQYGNPEFCEWSKESLLSELPHIKAELEQEALHDEITKRLLGVVENPDLDGQLAKTFKSIMRQYEIRRPLFSEQSC
jgi:hypothetical protein